MKDLAILGSGPGGHVAAIRAAQLGLSVTVVEADDRLGGVCTLRGCIPAKALLHCADVLEDIRRGGEIGVRGEPALDLDAAMAFKARVVDKSTKGLDFLFKKHRIEVVRGWGRVVDHGIAVGEQVIRARNVIVATGSSPRALPGVPFDGERVISSDEVLSLDRVPASMVVVGGGAVGVEMASAWSRFGARVRLLETAPRLLPREDEEISNELARALRRRGIDVQTGVQSLDLDGAEKVLVAIGRAPRTNEIGLEGLVRMQRGYIEVDARMRTNVPWLYAIGDVVPTPALAHVASEQGKIAVEAIAGRTPHPLEIDAIPNATYASPEVATIGLTEADARARGIEVKIGRFPFAASGKARILDRTEGFVKVIAEAARGEVLGVHMIGPRVSELLAEVATALRLGATTRDVLRAIHPHPTLSEALHGAVEAASDGALFL